MHKIAIRERYVEKNYYLYNYFDNFIGAISFFYAPIPEKLSGKIFFRKKSRRNSKRFIEI